MTDPSIRWRQANSPTASATLLPGMPSIRCLFQPIVDLSTEQTVGFEALARGIDDQSVAGNSDALFTWAQRAGRLNELDWACRMIAMQSALSLDMRAGCGLFINVEPAALGGTAPEGFDDLVQSLRDAGLAVVIEFTERALAENTAALLRLGDWIRDQGWAVAIDDIGADPGSLALVPLLRPEIIKLDLRLIQSRPTADVAQIVNAVNAEAGRTGALVLAEGIETEQQAALAVSMGAHLGQGWFFGRPAAEPSTDTAALGLPRRTAIPAGQLPDVPWELVQAGGRVRRAEKVLVEAMGSHLERQAMASADPAVVVGAFQTAAQYNASSASRFAELASSGVMTAVLGRGISDEPAGGVQGQHLSSHDPLSKEWSIAVVTAHFAGALIARDCGDDGDQATRRYDYVVTYDRDTVLTAAEIMLRRFVPRPTPDLVPDRALSIVRSAPAEALRHERQLPLVAKALAASSNGVTLVDAAIADMPLVYVNEGFERMTGYSAAEVLGRNCRFLQGPQTSRDAIEQLHAIVDSHTGGQVALLNYHRDGTPWWNEVSIWPVRDSAGVLTHFMAIQTDVTSRVAAESKAAEGRDRLREKDIASIGPRSNPKAESVYTMHKNPVITDVMGEEILPPVKDGRGGPHRPLITFAPAPVAILTPMPARVQAPVSMPATSPVASRVTSDLAGDSGPATLERTDAQTYLKSAIAEAKSAGGSVALLLGTLVGPEPAERQVDSRGFDSRGPDSRGPDSRGFDSHGPDSRGPDSRGVDSRGPDSREVDSRGPDSREVDLGEERLDMIGAALGATVGEDLLFRINSRQFGVISRLSATHNVVAAYALAGRMHRAVIEVADEAGVGMSIGIALSPADGSSAGLLWHNAEAALMLSEDSGPSATRFASDVAILRPARAEPAAQKTAAASSWPSW